VRQEGDEVRDAGPPRLGQQAVPPAKQLRQRACVLLAQPWEAEESTVSHHYIILALKEPACLPAGCAARRTAPPARPRAPGSALQRHGKSCLTKREAAILAHDPAKRDKQLRPPSCSRLGPAMDEPGVKPDICECSRQPAKATHSLHCARFSTMRCSKGTIETHSFTAGTHPAWTVPPAPRRRAAPSAWRPSPASLRPARSRCARPVPTAPAPRCLRCNCQAGSMSFDNEFDAEFAQPPLCLHQWLRWFASCAVEELTLQDKLANGPQNRVGSAARRPP